MTEPYLALFRRLLPMARIGAVDIDFSPVALLLVLFIAIQILVRLQRFGQRLAASVLPPEGGPVASGSTCRPRGPDGRNCVRGRP